MVESEEMGVMFGRQEAYPSFPKDCGEPMKLKVILAPEEEGGFSVAVPALPGCYTQGETLEEALANAREAAEGWLEVANDNPSPFDKDGEAAQEIVHEIDL